MEKTQEEPMTVEVVKKASNGQCSQKWGKRREKGPVYTFVPRGIIIPHVQLLPQRSPGVLEKMHGPTSFREETVQEGATRCLGSYSS